MGFKMGIVGLPNVGKSTLFNSLTRDDIHKIIDVEMGHLYKRVESLGYTTKTFKPAYIKDKRVFDPELPLKRAVGERIGRVPDSS